MATLLQPPVMHGRVVSGGGNKDKLAQRPWWDGNKPVSPRQPWQLGGNEARAAAVAVANQVPSVLRCDGEFLQAGRPPPVPRDVFWLRFLEKKQQQIRGGLALWEAAAQLPEATIQLAKIFAAENPTQVKNFFKLLYVRQASCWLNQDLSWTSLFEMSTGCAVNSHR